MRFNKNANFYEVNFDVVKLFPGVTDWNGRTFSCLLRLDTLRATNAWGGILFKDKQFHNDYGADIVFAGAGEWLDVTGVVGRQGEPNRWGGTAYYDPAFVASELARVIVFFAPSNEGVYPGKSVHIDNCRHWT